MTPEERKELVYKAVDAQTAGDKAELNRLMKLIPLAPTMAKAIKMSLGLDFLLSAGYDLSEVEAAYGREWLTN